MADSISKVDGNDQWAEIENRLDRELDQRKLAYSILIESTDIAVEIPRKNHTTAYITAMGGDLYAAKSAEDEAELVSREELERWLIEKDADCKIVKREDASSFQGLREKPSYLQPDSGQ